MNLLTKVSYKVKNLIKPSIDISDTYTELLAGVNAGWLERGNLYALSYAIEHLPSDAPIIEIGSFCGLSTNLIDYYKRKFGRSNKLINCDKWEWNDEGEIGESGVSYEAYLEFALSTYKRNVEMFSSALPFTVKEFSDDFFTLWREGKTVTDIFEREIELGGKISFAFIDGNHDYEFAKRDFDNTDEFLEPGGFILFDDSGDYSKWGVVKARDDVIASGRYEIVMKNPNYLFRKL